MAHCAGALCAAAVEWPQYCLRRSELRSRKWLCVLTLLENILPRALRTDSRSAWRLVPALSRIIVGLSSRYLSIIRWENVCVNEGLVWWCEGEAVRCVLWIQRSSSALDCQTLIFWLLCTVCSRHLCVLSLLFRIAPTSTTDPIGPARTGPHTGLGYWGSVSHPSVVVGL